MCKYFPLLLLVFIGIQLKAQSADTLNQETSPKGGINALALEYLKINFSKEQRAKLNDIALEFIYQIDPFGKPTLEAVHGVDDPGIIDSLQNRTQRLQNFNPKIVNGAPQAAIYIMRLQFPGNKMTDSRWGRSQSYLYREAKLTDFEYIHESGERLDALFGGLVNQFIGNPAKHLKLGGGMKVEVSYTAKNQLIYGLGMSFYGNKLKKEYPLSVNREQLSAPPTLFIGGIFGKWFHRFNLQLELNYAIQNVTAKKEEDDPDWVQLKGWSPGIIFNYPIKFGKDKPYYYYGSPSIFNNHVNLHLGLRPLLLSLKEASGGMIELGISYRMAFHFVDEYKIKADFLNR